MPAQSAWMRNARSERSSCAGCSERWHRAASAPMRARTSRKTRWSACAIGCRASAPRVGSRRGRWRSPPGSRSTSSGTNAGGMSPTRAASADARGPIAFEASADAPPDQPAAARAPARRAPRRARHQAHRQTTWRADRRAERLTARRDRQPARHGAQRASTSSATTHASAPSFTSRAPGSPSSMCSGCSHERSSCRSLIHRFTACSRCSARPALARDRLRAIPYARVAEYAELRAAGQPVPDALADVEQHQRLCANCREECHALVEVMRNDDL